MENRSLKCLFFGLLLAFLMGAGTPAFARDHSPEASDDGDDVLFNEEPIGDEDLDGMRGGFVTSNGMVIDFSFSANTLINGQFINQIVLNTANVSAAAGNLRRIIQVGEGNRAFDSGPVIDGLPNVLTVVQNNLDNLTIQQLNILDLTVQNMGNFINQAVRPEIEFQNTMTLAP